MTRNFLKAACFFFCCFIFGLAGAQQKGYAIHPVSLKAVHLADKFWSPIIARDVTTTIPYVLAECAKEGRVDNFEIAAHLKTGKFCGVYPFDDSDVYKAIEGASYSLMDHPDAKLEKHIDSLVAVIAAAQKPDGYLYTAREIGAGSLRNWIGATRWINERASSHEFYDAGHLYEAAVAYYEATGRKTLLDVALKNADLIAGIFGPDKKSITSGHEEIEIGLIKLFGVTHEKKYLDLAKFLVNQRGTIKHPGANNDNPYSTGAYSQDDKPVIDQTTAEGHAVRAMYLYAAMTDIVAMGGDSAYLEALDNIWQNMVFKKYYITGGIGAIGNWEGFGKDYQLPNLTAYCETCAAIGCVLWNERMFLLTGNAKYVDVLEKTLYNGLISGVSLSGDHFFYSNTLEVKKGFRDADAGPRRSPWFPCSCCPTNIVRLIPSIPEYIYAHRDNGIYINLFAGSETTIPLAKNEAVQVAQQTDYPWNGQVKITVNPAKKSRFILYIRIPGWLGAHPVAGDLYSFMDSTVQHPVLMINGREASFHEEKGYAVINREWKKGDQVEYDLPMTVKRVAANENVADDRGKVALQRGPVLFCAEWVDNNGSTSNLILPDDVKLTASFHKDLLNGVETITGTAHAITPAANGLAVVTKEQHFMAIPYYAWANRGPGEMTVWFPRRINGIDIIAGNKIVE
ncbi:MAG TPA: beta-L-arabinofuranosidase domain-containing protein [Chitinophagaceae bacterium]